MDESEKYAEMCVILGDVVFGLRQNGYEISRENLIKVSLISAYIASMSERQSVTSLSSTSFLMHKKIPRQACNEH